MYAHLRWLLPVLLAGMPPALLLGWWMGAGAQRWERLSAFLASRLSRRKIAREAKPSDRRLLVLAFWAAFVGFSCLAVDALVASNLAIHLGTLRWSISALRFLAVAAFLVTLFAYMLWQVNGVHVTPRRRTFFMAQLLIGVCLIGVLSVKIIEAGFSRDTWTDLMIPLASFLALWCLGMLAAWTASFHLRQRRVAR